MISKIKITFYLFVFLIILNSVVNSQETITVYTTYQHKITDNKPDPLKIAIDQKTYTQEDFLVLERLYDSEIGKQTFYILYFYNDSNKLISKECYSMNNKPEYLIRYNYNARGDTLVEIIFKPVKDTVFIESTITYEYNKNNKIARLRTFNSKNRLTETTDIYYNIKEMPEKKEINYKKCKTNNVKSIEINYIYNENDTLIKENSIQKDCKRNISESSVLYNYDKNGMLEKEIISTSGELLSKEEFYFMNNGILFRHNIFDKNNNLVKAFSFTEKNHFITLGNVKSYWGRK